MAPDAQVVLLPQAPQSTTDWQPTLEDALRFVQFIEAAYQRGYADAVRFVEAEAAQRAAANAEAGRGE